LSGNDVTSLKNASDLAREWDYSSDAPISLGTFYKVEQPTFDAVTSAPVKSRSQRLTAINDLLKKYV
jgi:hypothetical protein